MKRISLKTFIMAATLSTSFTARADEVSASFVVFSSATLCQKVSENSSESSWAAGTSWTFNTSDFKARSSITKTAEGPLGTLTTVISSFKVKSTDEQRVSVKTKFNAKDKGPSSPLKTNTIVGQNVIAHSGDCESQEDVGSYELSTHISQK